MVTTLDTEDAKLRYDVVKNGLDIMESEGMKISETSDEIVAEFVGGYYGLQGCDSQVARKLLGYKINGENVYSWIKRNYTHERLYAMYEFSNYCDWLVPKEIVNHFGKKLLCLFRELQGDPPKWCVDVPFHLVLQVAFVKRNAGVRKDAINKYLDKHWDEAEEYFDEYLPSPKHMMDMFSNFPTGIIEMHHVFTVYRRRQRDEESRKVKEYVKKESEQHGSN